MRKRLLRLAAGMAVIAILASAIYLRALALPFISDDYLHIEVARTYGPPSGWSQLAQDPLYRWRATSSLVTYWLDRLFGLDPLPFNITSLALHILNAGLVLLLGLWRRIGWKVSFFAACYFAIRQRHQEAVIWHAALPELLVFTFSMCALLCWILWQQSDGKRWWLYVASCFAFLLALLSKESAVFLVAFLFLWSLIDPAWRPRVLFLLPHAAAALIYAWIIYQSRASHQFFDDGTFSFSAPFWLVELRSTANLFRVWGALSLLFLAFCRFRRLRPILPVAALWIPLSLLPYSFLTYMPIVPSRHTYLASVGVSLIVGTAIVVFRERFRFRPWPQVALAAALFFYSGGYIWIYKHGQFEERARPTEQLVRLAAESSGPLKIRCFPYIEEVARSAVRLRVGSDVPLVFVSSPPQDEAYDLCSQDPSASPPRTRLQ